MLIVSLLYLIEFRYRYVVQRPNTSLKMGSFKTAKPRPSRPHNEYSSVHNRSHLDCHHRVPSMLCSGQVDEFLWQECCPPNNVPSHCHSHNVTSSSPLSSPFSSSPNSAHLPTSCLQKHARFRVRMGVAWCTIVTTVLTTMLLWSPLNAATSSPLNVNHVYTPSSSSSSLYSSTNSSPSSHAQLARPQEYAYEQMAIIRQHCQLNCPSQLVSSRSTVCEYPCFLIES